MEEEVWEVRKEGWTWLEGDDLKEVMVKEETGMKRGDGSYWHG